jgi:hypothetical protein
VCGQKRWQETPTSGTVLVDGRRQWPSAPSPSLGGCGTRFPLAMPSCVPITVSSCLATHLIAAHHPRRCVRSAPALACWLSQLLAASSVTARLSHWLLHQLRRSSCNTSCIPPPSLHLHAMRRFPVHIKVLTSYPRIHTHAHSHSHDALTIATLVLKHYSLAATTDQVFCWWRQAPWQPSATASLIPTPSPTKTRSGLERPRSSGSVVHRAACTSSVCAPLLSTAQPLLISPTDT